MKKLLGLLLLLVIPFVGCGFTPLFEPLEVGTQDGATHITSVQYHSELSYQESETFTIAFWIQYGGMTILHNIDVNGDGIKIYYSSGLNKIGFLHYTNHVQSSGPFTDVISPDGSWHHIVFTSAGDSTMDLFIDGEFDKGTTGEYWDPSGEDLAWYGGPSTQLANAVCWNVELTPAEIKALYQLGRPYRQVRIREADLQLGLTFDGYIDANDTAGGYGQLYPHDILGHTASCADFGRWNPDDQPEFISDAVEHFGWDSDGWLWGFTTVGMIATYWVFRRSPFFRWFVPVVILVVAAVLWLDLWVLALVVLGGGAIWLYRHREMMPEMGRIKLKLGRLSLTRTEGEVEGQRILHESKVATKPESDAIKLRLLRRKEEKND